MSNRIAPTTEANAPEGTRPLLVELKQALGMIPNVYAAAGHSPAALGSVLSWNASLGKNGLSKKEIEAISLHVSELNGCSYCISAHTVLGGMVQLTPEQISAARNGIGSTARENALLSFARRVVRTGGSRSGTDLMALREAKLSDAEVIDALGVIALTQFRNAVALVADTEIDFPKAPRLPTN